MSTPAKLFLEAALFLALLLAVLAGVKAIDQRGYQRAAAEYTVVIAKQKAQAAQLLATETIKARKAEEALRTFKLTQDNKDAQAQSTVADLSRRLHDLATRNAGRLRDPYAPGCGGSSSGPQRAATPAPGAGAADAAEAGGLLSAELSGLLQRLAREADEVNTAYISCRADSMGLRGAQ